MSAAVTLAPGVSFVPPPHAPEATASYAALTAAVKAARAAIPDRPPVPILGSVLIESGPHGLRLSGFDYDTSVRVDVHQNPADTFTAAVSAGFLATILASLAKGGGSAKMAAAPVVLSLEAGEFHPEVEAANSKPGHVAYSEPGTLTVTCDGFDYQLPCIDLDDYPPLPDPGREITARVVLQVDALRQGVQRVNVAAGKDTTLPFLTGIQLVADELGLTMVATDRFRLAVQQLPALGGEHFTVLAPAAGLLAVAKILPAGPVALAVSPGLLVVTAGNITATLRLLDLEFVKWRSLLPAKVAIGFTVDPATVRKAVNRVATVLEKRQHLLVHTVRDGADLTGIRFEAGSTADGGRATSPVIPVQGESDLADFTIRFNPAYLLAGLDQFPETLAIGFNTPGRPGLFAASVEELTSGEGFRYLAMPAKPPAA